MSRPIGSERSAAERVAAPRVLAIAHRGAHDATRPENSLPAMQHAVTLGADGIELDVHRTADGHLVVHHDPTPRGVSHRAALRGRPIIEMTLREVLTFDIGGGVRIPTLADVADAVAGRAMLFVELKGEGTAPLVAAYFAANPFPFAAHAFDHAAPRVVRETLPGARLGILETRRPTDPCAALAAADATDLWQRADRADAALGARAHACGARLIVWTPNTRRRWRRLMAAGVDGICTDALADFLRFRAVWEGAHS